MLTFTETHLLLRRGKERKYLITKYLKLRSIMAGRASCHSQNLCSNIYSLAGLWGWALWDSMAALH